MEKVAKGSRKRSESYQQRRDWGQMDSNILIFVFQRLLISDLLMGVAQVCREWRKAASYTRFFVSENQLSLQLVNVLSLKEKAIYVNLLKNAVTSTETNLQHLQFSHDVMLPDNVILDIAQRSTSLKSVHLPEASLIHFSQSSLLPKILPYWKNLTSFEAVAWRAPALDCIKIVGLHCKKLTHLGFYGLIEAAEAEVMVASFPKLRSLDFRSCFFSESALGIILDGVKNLKRIDLTHAVCGGDDMKEFATKVVWKTGAKELRPEIHEKLKALDSFTYCGGKGCWHCSWFYTVSSD